ncbi:MAG: polyhydroxyalkanoate depolymerase, partial [Acetobacteraceae bacterium]|nr:polyhydroxyalkanoate depolymerase [Acetobacteraceae bacterium]
MLYDTYEWQRQMMAGASAMASWTSKLLADPANPFGSLGGGKVTASALDVFAHASAPRGKPAFGLRATVVEGREVAVSEEVVVDRPFGRLMRFHREGVEGGPKLLIVAPMSGHYATLLRGTVERMLPVADVHITDWADAKMVPLSAGSFDFGDYVDYLIAFLEAIGPGAHMLAVCQPSVLCSVAACLMSSGKHPCRPRTLTMMGGPIDTRKAPTAVNTLATQRPFAWFEHNVIATVPYTYPGAGRA